MTVVLDCNIFVMCLTSKSPYHFIYQSLVRDKFNIAVSSEILLEYEEVIQMKYGIITAGTFISLLNELPNVHHVTPHFKWELVTNDPDDNKYCDCAIAGKASHIVTEDKHFAFLKTISFPPLSTFSIDEFVEVLKSL
jgi:uncharacterized protein